MDHIKKKIFPSTDTLKFCLCLLRLGGQDPKHNTLLPKLFTLFYTCTTCVVFTLVICKYVKSGRSIDEMALLFSSASALYQLLSKLFLLIHRKRKLSELMGDFEKFRRWENADEETLRKINEIDWLNRLFVFGLRNGGCAHVLAFYVTPLFKNERQLPIPCWMPEGNPLVVYVVLYCAEMFVFFVVFAVVVGSDCLYATICSKIAIQFRLLHCDFKCMRDDDDDEELLIRMKQLVNHHEFLLRCCDAVQEIFSFSLLNQYVVSVATLCVQMYLSSESLSDLSNLISASLYSGIMLFELGLYCIFATVLNDEVSRIPQAVYSSEWYLIKNRRFRKSLQMVMIRGQKPNVLMGGGILVINMECYVTVLRTAISFFTFMKKMKRH